MAVEFVAVLSEVGEGGTEFGEHGDYPLSQPARES